jgi:hypothetical protein
LLIVNTSINVNFDPLPRVNIYRGWTVSTLQTWSVTRLWSEVQYDTCLGPIGLKTTIVVNILHMKNLLTHMTRCCFTNAMARDSYASHTTSMNKRRGNHSTFTTLAIHRWMILVFYILRFGSPRFNGKSFFSYQFLRFWPHISNHFGIFLESSLISAEVVKVLWYSHWLVICNLCQNQFPCGQTFMCPFSINRVGNTILLSMF